MSNSGRDADGHAPGCSLRQRNANQWAVAVGWLLLAAAVLLGWIALESRKDWLQPVSVDSRLDLNRASAGELQRLPGIGPRLAAAIVEHRQRQGPFQTLEQLQDVPGIGPAKWQAVRHHLMLQSEGEVGDRADLQKNGRVVSVAGSVPTSRGPTPSDPTAGGGTAAR